MQKLFRRMALMRCHFPCEVHKLSSCDLDTLAPSGFNQLLNLFHPRSIYLPATLVHSEVEQKELKGKPAEMGALSQSVEVRIKGHWVSAPVLEANGEKLVARGKFLKIAYVRGEEMKEDELDNPEHYLEALKNDPNRILDADIFSFTQKLPATVPKYRYPIEWESVAAIPIISFKTWWEGLPQETRKNVRRAQKRGVVIKIKMFDDDLIAGIREVNDDSPLRQGMTNAYYGLTSEQTRKRYSEFLGRCDFVCAYSGDEMIGFLHIVYRRDIAAILNLTTKPSQFDKRPANALLAKAVELCEARGISHISYGLYNYGNKRGGSLREFKIRNGFMEIRVPRYFVPLTLWGRLCMKARLHRGLIGNLPPSAIAVGVRVRAFWYDFANSHKPV